MRSLAGSTSMLVRNLPWNADDLRHSSLNSSIETANIVSDNEGDKVEIHGQEVAGSSTQANVWHSDNELNRKDFLPRVGKRNEGYRSLESEKRYISELKSEWKDAGRAAGLPVISGHMEDPVGVPPEWTPPNVCASVLNLVDKIFQLNRRGWIRRPVFWISKQMLQLVMEDAIDDWLLRQISWLRREDVIAQGIRWVQYVLWPDGKFSLKLEIPQGLLEETEFGYRCSENTKRSAGNKVSHPGSFEVQLEAAWRASNVKKIIFINKFW